MKIAFVSGFLNNHILPFCEELNKNTEFYFIATENANFTAYNRETIKADFVINYFEQKDKETACEIIKTCDVAIFGGNSDELLAIRKKTGKLSFIYTERFFKKGAWRRFIPSTKKTLHKRFIKDNENLYVLCAGSFVAKDLKLINFNTNKCFKFGYFPFVDIQPFEELIKSKNHDKLNLIYVGRLLKLKRVKDILRCSKLLKNNHIPFELKIIGDGPEKQNLYTMCETLNILDNVSFIGKKTQKEVFKYMKESSILCFSSDFHEGWGAVVNEALSNACLVIESDACGSAKYLIKDNYNGAIYRMGDAKDMYKKIHFLISSKDIIELHKNAYDTINNLWNSETATKRLITISKCLLDGKNICEYSEGPMSKG